MKRMNMFRLATVLAACVVMASGACGGSSDTPTDSGSDTADLPDASDVGIDGGTDDGAPDARDIGEDSPELPGDVPCSCDETNECCNGCHPLKEGEACAMETVPFCKTAACVSGTCSLVDLVCVPDGKCATQTGTCNAANGICEFPDALPDGESCVARDEIDGSGSCLFGKCREFASCDYRAYDQAPGMPCNFNSECASGMCRSGGMGWDMFCSMSCENGTACPDSLRCVKDAAGDYFCERVGTDNYPGDGTIGLFKPCNRDEDCAGQMCLGYGDKRFCSQNCEADAGGAKDSAKCGECGTCRDDGTENEFKFNYYCVPDGDGVPGDPCQSPMDCGNHFCYEGYCSDQCLIISEEFDSCPEGFKCVADAYMEGLQTCVADTSLDHEFGESCKHDYECKSAMCRAIGAKNICVDTCDDCAGGACVQTGWIQTDTFIELWQQGKDDAAVATSDYGSAGGLASLSYYAQTAGVYYLLIRGGTTDATGPYVLNVKVGDQVIPAAIAESEANDTREAAENKAAPFAVNAMLEAAGQDWFKFEVTFVEGQTSANIRIETLQVADNACVPTTIDGTTVYGGACAWDWECVDGMSCLEGMCNKTCTIDGDCPNGICFAYSDTDSRCVPQDLIGKGEVSDACQYGWECADECYPDEYLQEYYCSKACTKDENCPWGMGCLDSMCSKGFPTPSFPYGYCRMNADCESFMCIDGICTADCTEDNDCEGNAAIVPSGPKQLCSSCETNADCNEGTEDMFSEAYCVAVTETEKFCAPQCTFDPTGCPEGTRCYQIDWFTSVCAPVAFTCAGGRIGCEATNGICLRPFIVDGDACRYDEECVGGKCAGGICRSEQCDNTMECGCDLLECKDHYCQFTAGDDRILEVEPNNTPETAQEIMSVPVKVVAGFNAEGNLIDNDLFKVNVTAGNAYNFNATAACGTESDPAMLLRDSTGAYIDGWAIDDKSQTDYFPALFGYIPETTGFVYVEIVQGPYVQGVLRTPYVFEVTTFVPASDNTCANASAMDLNQPFNNNVTFGTYTDSIVPPTDFGQIWGPDLAKYVDVPGVTAMGHYSAVSLGFAVDPAAADLVMYAIKDCADPNGSLVNWSNFNVGTNGQERLTLVNETADPVRYYVVFDTYSWDVQTLGVTYMVEATDRLNPVTGDTMAQAETLEPDNGVPAETVVNLALPYTDAVHPAQDACEGKTTTGKDHIFKVMVPQGMFLKAEVTNAWTTPVMYILDGDDADGCVAFGSNLLYYMPPQNKTPVEDIPVYVVVESGTHKGGELKFTATVEPVGPCAGPCDPTAATAECLQGGKLCACDETTKFFTKIDCNASCMSNGMSLSGTCHMFNTEGVAVGAKCSCEYDCAMEGLVDNMCGYGAYTNCTCAGSDPCGWVGDGACDQFCANEFTGGFQDTQDCTPAE